MPGLFGSLEAGAAAAGAAGAQQGLQSQIEIFMNKMNEYRNNGWATGYEVSKLFDPEVNKMSFEQFTQARNDKANRMFQKVAGYKQNPALYPLTAQDMLEGKQLFGDRFYQGLSIPATPAASAGATGYLKGVSGLRELVEAHKKDISSQAATIAGKDAAIATKPETYLKANFNQAYQDVMSNSPGIVQDKIVKYFTFVAAGIPSAEINKKFSQANMQNVVLEAALQEEGINPEQFRSSNGLLNLDSIMTLGDTDARIKNAIDRASSGLAAWENAQGVANNLIRANTGNVGAGERLGIFMKKGWGGAFLTAAGIGSTLAGNPAFGVPLIAAGGTGLGIAIQDAFKPASEIGSQKTGEQFSKNVGFETDRATIKALYRDEFGADLPDTFWESAGKGLGIVAENANIPAVKKAASGVASFIPQLPKKVLIYSKTTGDEYEVDPTGYADMNKAVETKGDKRYVDDTVIQNYLRVAPDKIKKRTFKQGTGTDKGTATPATDEFDQYFTPSAIGRK